MDRDPDEAVRLAAALDRLSADYWFEVDHHGGDDAHLFFVDHDPVYQIQDQVFAGRDAISSFYRWRKERGARVARHCTTNSRAFRHDDGTAGMTSILLLFAADGKPVLPVTPPILIADVVDHCEFLDGTWKYRSKRLTTLFAGEAPITLPVSGQ